MAYPPAALNSLQTGHGQPRIEVSAAAWQLIIYTSSITFYQCSSSGIVYCCGCCCSCSCSCCCYDSELEL